jgi:polar amino acid transport system substrate-binding protein
MNVAAQTNERRTIMHVERVEAPRGTKLRLAPRVLATIAAAVVALAAVPATAATLDRIRESGSIRFGYLVDASPLSFRNDAGKADGYAVALCGLVADQIKAQFAPGLRVEWVPVAFEDRVASVQQGSIDLLCTPMSVTLDRRQEVSFSIPVFAGGNRAVLRAEAPTALLNALSESPGARKVVWRGSPAAKVLKGTSIAVVSGTTSEKWLAERRDALQVDAKIVPVPDHRTGIQQLREGEVDVFFADRSIALGAIPAAERRDFVLLDRQFTHESLALAMARSDDDFRLAVDRALSRLYASDDFGELYKQWYGEFGEKTRAYFAEYAYAD